jgi:hypothetical protein
MKLADLKKDIQQYMYLEDTGVIDVVIATVIANRFSLDDKVWLAVVGESSGGKSQIINPILKSDEDYFIKVDDITDNTFLSGFGGKEVNNSLLSPDKVNNMLVFSDLTVLFSRNQESRNAVLSQFRMIFDGYMTKHTGTKGVLQWRGRMGVLAGCTPSIYRHFDEVADMGERFLYYRLKTNDPHKATELVLNRMIFGAKLDDNLSDAYNSYMRAVGGWVIENKKNIDISDDIKAHILKIAMFAEQVRTPVHVDKYSGKITDIPVSAMPMRTALQLKSVAKGLIAMNMYEGSEVIDVKKILDWVAFSLADENKRKTLEVFSALDWDGGQTVTSQQVADYIGLETSVATTLLVRLMASKVIQRISGSGAHKYRMYNKEYHDILCRVIENRDIEIPEEREEEK